MDDTKKSWEEEEHGPHVEEIVENEDIDEPTSFLYHVYLGCSQRECKPNVTTIDQDQKVFESRVSVCATEIHPVGKSLTRFVAWSCDMEGHARKCVERYCELAKKWCSCSKSQLFAWMITNSNRTNLNQSENCQKFVHKLF